MKTWKLVFYLKNAFRRWVNAFIKEKKHSESKGTHSLPFHTITECFLLGSKTVLHLDRKRSEPFHKLIEWVSVRSFWNGQKRIPSKWDRVLWRSLEKHLRMDSLNWWTHSRQSNIILRKKRMYSSPFSKLLKAFIWIQRQFWFKIGSSEAVHVDSDAKNGGTFDELYPRADSRDFEKNVFDHSLGYGKSEYTFR